MIDAPVLARSEYEKWPPELRAAWDALRPADERLMLRARMVWRGYLNPGPTPPKSPLRRDDLNHVTALLWAQERAYRARSACRGADGNVTLNTHAPREQGHQIELTALDALALLRGKYDGSTLTELSDLLPGVGRNTVKKWLGMLEEHGQAYPRTVNGIPLFYAVKDWR